jgi:uncharacterized alkaline shock family protein YloU
MEVQGITTLNNDVLIKIAVQTAQEVDGVAQVGASSAGRSIAKMFGRGQTSNAGINVNPGEPGSGETSFNLTLATEFGYSIPDVVRNIREAISNRIKDITGLTVNNIDIYVEDIVDTSQQNKAAVPLVGSIISKKDRDEEKPKKPVATQLPEDIVDTSQQNKAAVPPVGSLHSKKDRDEEKTKTPVTT